VEFDDTLLGDPSPSGAETMKIRDRIIRFDRVPASELLPHPKNWRTHPQAQRDALKGVLAEIGYAGACLVRETEHGLMLIDGHLRAETTPDAMVPVLVLNVNEQEAEKLLLTYDPLSAMAQADKEALAKLMREVDVENLAVKEMLDNLAVEHHLLGPESTGLVDPDDIPSAPDAAATLPGDLYILGNHRLLCADSRKPENVDRLLDGAEIHLVNTDPPYNVRVEPRSNNAIAAGLSSFPSAREMENRHHQGFDLARHPEKSKPTQKKLRAKDRPLENDFVTDEAFDEMLHAWFGNMARVLVPGGSFYIWGGYANLGNYPPVLKKCGLYFSQGIIWNKMHPVLTRKDFMGCFEIAYYGWKEGAGHKFYGTPNAYDLWDIKKVNPQNMIHLTEKPVELASRAMQYSSRPGQNVLDLFGGSGSTLVAAEQTGRRAFLMELDTLYADIIVERYVRFVGLPGKVRVLRDGKEYTLQEVKDIAAKAAQAAGEARPVEKDAEASET